MILQGSVESLKKAELGNQPSSFKYELNGRRGSTVVAHFVNDLYPDWHLARPIGTLIPCRYPARPRREGVAVSCAVLRPSILG